MGFSHLLSWLDLWWHRQSLQIYQKSKLVLFYLFQISCIVLLHECAHRCGKFVVSCSVLSTFFLQASGREIWTLVVWMYIICLVHFLDSQWWFDPLCLGADLILSVLLALGCLCGHLQLQDVASLLIFGPSQVFACELKLDLKFCTICKLACLDQQEPLWFQFTCMCRMMLKSTEAEIIYGHVQPSISSFIIYIFTSRPAISRVTICLLLCEKLGQWLTRFHSRRNWSSNLSCFAPCWNEPNRLTIV